MTIPDPLQIHVAVATDANFAQHATVTLYSLCENNPGENLCLYVLYTGLALKERDNISQSLSGFKHANLVFVDIDDGQFSHLQTGFQDRTGRTNYFRLLLPQLLGTVTEKLIYLDSDIVVTGNIRKLWDLDLGEHFFAAVENPWHQLARRHHDLGLATNAPYFNSGMMLLNLKRLQNMDLIKGLSDAIADSSIHVMKGSDMDGLNAMFRNGWFKLGPEWNVISTHVFLAEFYGESGMSSADYVFTDSPKDICAAVRTPSIIHFTGHPKPWMSSCRHPFSGLYRHYLRQTRWHDSPPGKDHLKVRLREKVVRLAVTVGKFLPVHLKNWMVARAYRPPWNSGQRK